MARSSHLFGAFAAAQLLRFACFAQVANPEVEPNDGKIVATVASSCGEGMQSGDFLSGMSVGGSAAGLDYFRVRVRPAVAGIYRHRLRLTTTGPVGHTGTIRGLSQIEGVISVVSDIALQTSSSGTAPSRMNQWYGFGAGEEFLYRVTGAAATTAPYVATLFTEPVIPVTGPDVPAGVVVITTIGQGHTSDTDMWLYDGDFNAIVDGGNDDESVVGGGTGGTFQSRLVRSLGVGTYYLAISNFNSCNNLASAADDDSRAGGVLDFPGTFANGSTQAGVNLRVSIGGVVVSAAKSGPFDVAWVRFVCAGSCPWELSQCPADADGDDDVDSDDVVAFFALFEEGETCCDQDNDDDADSDDVARFFQLFESGGC